MHSRELFPYHFRTELTVTIDEKSLQVKLDAFNTGDELFTFTAALHTYIAVADIDLIKLDLGLLLSAVESAMRAPRVSGYAIVLVIVPS